MTRPDVTSRHGIGKDQSKWGLAELCPAGPGSADITQAEARSTLTPA
jgi:hypothetical protein